MTQEELDALLNSDVEDGEQMPAEDEPKSDSIAVKTENNAVVTQDDFKIDGETSWPPPPPTTEHKVVHQLDDVTRDSEVKATEMFDKLEQINNASADIEDAFGGIKGFLDSQEALMNKLHAKFPDFHTFTDKLDEITKVRTSCDTISEKLEEIANVSLEAMDNMQYQDIHRQKIERVINVMRALSRYMSSLFEGKIDDSKRVSSAVYIQGDAADNAMNEDDIEALLQTFQK